MNPRELPWQVDLLPGQPGHVRSAKSGRQREGRHVAQMRRQLAQERARLVFIDECPIDTLQIPVGQMAIQPAQSFFVVIERGFVCLLAKPTNGCILPDALWPIPQSLLPPEFTFQPVVQLLRLGLVGSLSSSAYSLTTWGGKVDLPDCTALDK